MAADARRGRPRGAPADVRLRIRVPVTDGGESDDHEPHARAHVGEGLGVGGPRVAVKVAELDVLEVEYGRAEEYRTEEEEDSEDEEGDEDEEQEEAE